MVDIYEMSEKNGIFRKNKKIISSYTSNVAYELYRNRQLEGKKRSTLIFCVSSLLAACSAAAIILMQIDEYKAFINDRFDYINRTKELCSKLEIVNIDMTSTPLAFLIIFLYILLYKRRVFLREKFKYRNVGCKFKYYKNELYLFICLYIL